MVTGHHTYKQSKQDGRPPPDFKFSDSFLELTTIPYFQKKVEQTPLKKTDKISQLKTK